MYELKPISFINEEITVHHAIDPIYKRTPTPPDSFSWGGETFEITEILLEWKDYDRRGKNAHNIRPSSLLKAVKRGSRAVGRFYFRVLTAQDRIFQLYFDRANWDTDQQTGTWILQSEYSYQLKLPNR
jgi:hypothetical protein